MLRARRHAVARRALAASVLLAACLAVAPAPALAAPPAPPTFTDVDPDSPADDTSPEVKGSAEAGSTVTIYTDPSCMTVPVGQGSAATFATPGVTVAVAPNSITTFYANATNLDGTSACSTSTLAYAEAPAAPVLVDSSPPSPSSDNAPRFRGSAEAATTVRLYRNATCTGELVGTGSAAELASPGISVAVADNSTTTVWALAVNANSTASACSATFVTYVHEAARPAPPVLTDTDPDSPANDNMPFLKGTAVAGGIVRIYTTPTCTGPRAGENLSAVLAAPGIQTSVLNDATTTLYATVTNSAGATSPCSSGLTYVEDSTPPETTITAGPASTVDASSTVRFAFESSEAGARFECHLHDPGYQPCSSPATFPALRSETLQVRAIDRAGNADGTPATRSYTVGARAAPPPVRTGCPLRVAAVSGTARADTLHGTPRADLLLGRGGDDLLRGFAGDDCLYGEAGADRLRGAAGADRLFGGPGADRLDGQAGNDRLSGAAGDDRLTDRSGRDTFYAGSGNDVVDARDTTLAGRRVRDAVSCGPGRDRVLADRRDRVQRDCERISRF